MHGGGVHAVELVFLSLLAFVVLFAAVARKLNRPYPIVLVVAGLPIGKLVEGFERHIDDGPIEIAVSILVPYATYLAAVAAHASGVLAVIACGLYLSRKSAHFFSPNVRLQAWAVWESLTFALNGLVLRNENFVTRQPENLRENPSA